jgi:hypothetical protein
MRGHEIHFVCGKYAHKSGWIDNEKEETKKMIYVIVDLGNGSTKKTQVNMESVGKPQESPSNYAEAILQQCPNIEVKMDKLCQEIAKCSVAIYGSAMLEFLSNKFQQATDEQTDKGSKATYRHVSHNTAGNAGN